MKHLTIACVITFILIIGGCVSTDNKVPSKPQQLSDLPAVSNPPDINTYFNGDGTAEKYEVNKYYGALTTYVAYVKGYMQFLGIQYNLSDYKLSVACEEALSRQIPIKTLPPIPDIMQYPDGEVIDVLVAYIGLLRDTIYSFNTQIGNKLHDVNRYCPK